MELELLFRKFFLSFVLFGLTLGLSAQIVNIPDQNFKNALLNHTPVIDTNNDGEIQVSEAQVVTILYVSGKSIQDLTGIGSFVNITGLFCNDNQLTSIDLSQNTVLNTLECSNNQFATLDISQYAALYSLSCSGNQLTSLDLSQNPGLEYLNVRNNFLTSLDISQNNLDVLDCSFNQLTSLDLSQQSNLYSLICIGNQLVNLDTSLNMGLTILGCSYNNLTSLDLTQNISLGVFGAEHNQLTFLDVRNGNNTAITLFDTQNNPDLKCIFVDDATYSENHPDWFRDPASTYVETQAQCDALGTKDLAFQQLMVYPNPVRTHFYITNPQNLQIEKVAVYDVLGKKVKSFGSNTRVYAISGLHNGLYFVTIYSGNKSLTRKIIKK